MTKALKGVWILLLCASIAACSQLNNSLEAPQAVEGTLNLTGWDFEQDGSVSLSGEWEFHWQELLHPDQINTDVNFTYVPVPDNWTSYKINDQDLPPEGFATYRLVVQFPDPSQVYGLLIEGEGTAYNLWVDGEIVANNGLVADNEKEMIPKSKPEVVFFHPNGDTTEFVVQISNWQHRKAGFRNEIMVGTPEQIHEHQNNEKSFEAALMGIYFIMALYHIFIYGFRPSSQSPLYFSLLGLLYFVRTGLLNQKLLLLLLPAMSWSTALRIEYLTFYLVSPIYALFIQSLYPEDIPRWIIRIITGLAAGFVGYMFLIDTLALSYTTTAYQGILLIETAYFVFFMGRIVARKREGAFYITFASFIAFIGIVLEILSLQNIIPIEVNGSLTFIAFIFIQAILLSSRFSKSFKRVEVLSGELKEANVNLTESERKYRSIFDGSKDMIFIASLDEQIKDANPTSEEILGYTRDELLQMKMSDIVIHHRDKEKIENTLRGNEIVRDYELELRRKNGSIIHGLVTLTIRRNDSGEPFELQGNIHDISARIDAETERYRAMTFEQLSITDPLTNIYNRRIFDEMAVKEWERAKRSQSALTVVLFDVDRFKQVNDTYGHLTGDQVLINLADLCLSNMRSMDVFARYGGEEFVVLMPDADAQSAHQTIERLRTIVETTPLANSENPDLFVTISAGIVTWDGKESLDIQTLLARADEALYTSKQTGRNKVTIWKHT
ncbi:MAG TPA: diguanylate cyclase [Anaerolineales bacterium]|nr:diguanylate cyclase [Anaerolineales bacterium]